MPRPVAAPTAPPTRPAEPRPPVLTSLNSSDLALIDALFRSHAAANPCFGKQVQARK